MPAQDSTTFFHWYLKRKDNKCKNTCVFTCLSVWVSKLLPSHVKEFNVHLHLQTICVVSASYWCVTLLLPFIAAGLVAGVFRFVMNKSNKNIKTSIESESLQLNTVQLLPSICFVQISAQQDDGKVYSYYFYVIQLIGLPFPRRRAVSPRMSLQFSGQTSTVSRRRSRTPPTPDTMQCSSTQRNAMQCKPKQSTSLIPCPLMFSTGTAHAQPNPKAGVLSCK